jgi:hypothetical protein
MMESLAGLLSSTGLIFEPLFTTKNKESGLGLFPRETAGGK